MSIKHYLYQFLTLLLVSELVYLLAVNLVLNLPLTQNLINKHRPEQYTVYWTKAWSWYPFRVHARDISVNGQSDSQQWQVEISSAAASLNIFPLILRKVNIYDVSVHDIIYFQRPRPRRDKDYSKIREFFPTIRDRELEIEVPTPATRKKGGKWDISVKSMHAKGKHHVWIFQMQGDFSGELGGDIKFMSPGGPFALENGMVNVNVDSLKLNGDQQVTSKGFVKGQLGLSPFIPAENKGPKVMTFLNLNIDVSAEVGNLKFLDFYLDRLYGINLDGKGEMNGHLHFEDGTVLATTDIGIAATELSLNLLAYQAEGQGEIKIKVNPDKPDVVSLGIKFANLEARHQDDKIPSFIGEEFQIATQSPAKLLPLEYLDVGSGYVSVSIQNARVPDLSVYQRYVPDTGKIKLLGGQGKLQGTAELTPESLNVGFDLFSDQADLAFKDYQFTTDLAVGVYADIPLATETGKIDISGTFLRLDNSHLTNENSGSAQSWETELRIDEGIIVLPVAEVIEGQEDINSVLKTLKQTDFRKLLEAADAEFTINGKVSDLAWINLLLKNPYNLSVGGAGEIFAEMHIESGLPAEGSIVEASSQDLEMEILDYIATGAGMVAMEITRGGEKPDLDLDLEIGDAFLRRKDEDTAFVEDVELKLLARGTNLAFDGQDKLSEIHLQIPSAKITDMSVYNSYFPDQTPFRFSGGSADLKVDINLKPRSADGYVRLKTDQLEMTVNDQELWANLTADFKLAGGRPREMFFDISGSHLFLDNVKIAGEERQFDDENWSAQLDLTKGTARWKKPVRIAAEANLLISDSTPVVTLFSNEKNSPVWLQKLLTTENIKGNAKFMLDNRQLTIPYAYVSSDKIDAGAKGTMNDQELKGLFYLRYRKLDAVLKIENKKRNLDIFRAKKKFEEYSTKQ